MRLIAELLNLQDPVRPHTSLTRILISLIIIASEIIYAGFFGVIGAVIVYLACVELMAMDPAWPLAPIGIALLVGLGRSFRSLREYWLHHGHGQAADTR